MNAIILAAGLGSRLRPLTTKVPKSQIKVNGMALIERQIEFLQVAGITEITVVTGHLHDKFNYLKSQYGVALVHNDKFADYNNIYSMYLVKEQLGDSFVIDADVYWHRNFILSMPKKSTYFSAYKQGFENEEWLLKYDEATKKLQKIIITTGNNADAGGRIMSGISYWTKKDCEIIKAKLELAIKNRNFTDLYWDCLIVENLALLEIYVEELEANDIFEIDTKADLIAVAKTVYRLSL